eukprot:GHVL01036069.1.p1 GENE.GHVL01036069.1~~GHVL01036069.1.p1  ORF type:complete len:4080 (+),score=886.02 GHVL01036069.1:1188-12242(+)
MKISDDEKIALEKVYDSLTKTLINYQEAKFKQWKDESIDFAKDKLKESLLKRVDKTGLIKVNFDTSLVRLLREVKYLLSLGLDVPDSAKDIYKYSETLRIQNGNLDRIVQKYNGILTELHPVEEPLLDDRIKKMDVILHEGLSNLGWRSTNMSTFIKDAGTSVHEVYTIVDSLKTNLKDTTKILHRWSEKPLFERKPKPMPVEELESAHKSGIQLRHQLMVEDGKSIHKYIRNSNDCLKISKTASTWKDYVDYVNSCIIEGLVSSVATSLNYLCDILNPALIIKREELPLFEIRLELSADKVIGFEPSYECTKNQTGVRDVILGWVKDYFTVGTCMSRVDTQTGDYLPDLKEHFQILSLQSKLTYLLDSTNIKCNEFSSTFTKYKYLWTDDIDEVFSNFLETSNPIPLVSDFEQNDDGKSFIEIMDMIKIDVGPPMPHLNDFGAKIVEFENILYEIAEAPTPVIIDWLKIDVQPMKRDLGRIASLASNKFLTFIRTYVINTINSLDIFIQRTIKGLSSDVSGDIDKKILFDVMTNIRDVKMSSEAVKVLFLPLKEMTLLVKKHSSPLPDEILLKLDKAASQWDEIKKTSLEVKDAIEPLQVNEKANIRKELENFTKEVKDYRSNFLKAAPFDPELTDETAYSLIDEFWQSTLKIELLAKDFDNLETLFDMPRSGYRELKECRTDLIGLKNVWDWISMVRCTFGTWKSTLWDDIDTEDLLTQTKGIEQQLKGVPKTIRGWKIYNWLMKMVQNMAVVLPAVNELHSKEVKDRHWRKLSTVTNKPIEKGPEFCLDSLLQLELHNFSEDVDAIVEQAKKEDKIERRLVAIKGAWSKMELQMERVREDVPTIIDISETLETLDQHQMELMAMVSQGKFVEFIKKDVDAWQLRLRSVDTVLNALIKVMNNWLRLEPIFMQSEDIRSQLPAESKLFETLDSDIKEIMKDAEAQPLIIEACCVDGREQQLNDLSILIEKCEKALNDYLEQKKKSFPRFYFVSNQALLDILSNANNPIKVNDYIADCFEGIKSLNFVENSKGGLAKGMISPEGEMVPFLSDFKCEGAVEVWLTNLEEKMRRTLNEWLEQARISADNWEVGELPREKEWLNRYCTQVALVASQIVWTEEVIRALEDIEGGSESAMKDYKTICDDRIRKLIRRVQGPLNGNDRVKIITQITIDVHARDVVDKFVITKLSDQSAFMWQSQLRFYWITSVSKIEEKVCKIKICDWQSEYMNEYVGNCGRLVITPLTDRCYITLTQALNLTMGGAPAGPAGTGKTETTKDLGRAIGLPVKVFNCSDQMNFVSMGQIFMGLAQTGAWGCFDEFNRISIEVLSVVATQVKSILDAIRQQKDRLFFMDEDISLVRTTGFFITMNPGYAGRTELPENLKALFRSCAMVVPDIKFICENMLMSEGFENARSLADKFVTLYQLCKELLSKAMHYDWGLRAVKAVLRQAGGLKRGDPDTPEDPILMRALRDFNTPKITTEDRPIFIRLINDLFPGIDIPPKMDMDFFKVVEQVTVESQLQPEKSFIGKVVSLRDILCVRHCCFVLGPPGSSKSCVWKILMNALKVNPASPEDGVYEALNPKGITSNELYGFMTKTKEWRDGAIAGIMRNMSKNMNGFKASQKHKWIILDGDIDAEWIESMNTVMDDNKVLTLVSNERIPFNLDMRMLFEIADMRHASPATVSRGGVLFINECDVGWKPLVESWTQTLPDKFTKAFCVRSDDGVIAAQQAQSSFYLLFCNIFEANIDQIRKNVQFICPMWDIAFVQSICCFLDGLICSSPKEQVEAMKQSSQDQLKIIFEAYFMYAFMWSVGGCTADDKTVNHRNAFNSSVRAMCKHAKFPDGGSCFDYWWDSTSNASGSMNGWRNWKDDVPPYEPITNQMYQNIVISNLDTVRMQYNLQLHIKQQRNVLFVGSVGTGKTTFVKDYYRTLDETAVSAIINLNSYTDSATLQRVIESKIEKQTGRTYGPPTGKVILFFLDDLNMPAVDKYDTQSPLALLRQLIDYKFFFDRDHLEERKDLTGMQYIGAMNPKAGSFNIDPRLQRQFTVLSCLTPSSQLVNQIFSTILERHLITFDKPTQGLCDSIVKASIDCFQGILSQPAFLPSAKRFHYTFNLRDVSNVFQGILRSDAAFFKGAEGEIKFARLWAHETMRVYADRFISYEDQETFRKDLLETVAAKNFTTIPKEELWIDTNIFTAFAARDDRRPYLPAKNMASLKEVVEEKLSEHNDEKPALPLVLFTDAIEHVCRICRVLDLPCGHALLIGVGGSGKQSLSRLSSYINGFEVNQIVVSGSFGINDLKEKLQLMYIAAAVKTAQGGPPQVFLMTDLQIADERFLIFINDLLASGNIPDLFTKEEWDSNCNLIRNTAKSQGVSDQQDELMRFFIDRVRQNLHVIMCHSPVGSSLRVRARKFPALISCTVLDWFHPWPREALIDVATRFLNEVEMPTDDIKIVISKHMAHVHISIKKANEDFLNLERRYNYTTPKSFLELIDFYKFLLNKKRKTVEIASERLQKGLYTLHDTSTKVLGLQKDLKITMEKVKEKTQSTKILIEQVTKASEDAAEDEKAANEEADKTNALASDAAKIQAEADEELKESLPAMEAAKAAVDCLTKTAIQELKSLGKPPPECETVAKAVMILMPQYSKGKVEWKDAQKMMNPPGRFLEEIQEFDGENLGRPPKVKGDADSEAKAKKEQDAALLRLEPEMTQAFFNKETMMKKSQAAAYLCDWVINIVSFYKIYQKVAPLMQNLDEASERKKKAESDLAVVMNQLKEVQEKVAELQRTLSEAEADLQGAEEEKANGESKLAMANKLVNGLAGERDRWTREVEDLKEQRLTLIGDALISAAFVSYIGAFSSSFRNELWINIWLPDLKEKELPYTQGVDPLSILSSQCDQATWKNEGLPADRVSLENASILVSCARWPLLIDPQLQGLKWIKNRYGDELCTIQLTNEKRMMKLKQAIQNGVPLLIEGVGEELDAAMEPILSRAIVKKQKTLYIKIDGEDIEYDKKFKLYIQSKWSNPHYRPEVTAQCTIINFIVTPEGLEDQILAMVVNAEKPELEETKQELVRQQNDFQVSLAALEDELLEQLSSADPSTILDNIELIEGLENTKETSKKIAEQVIESKKTEESINISRNKYRPVASEGSMLYFLLIQLCIVNAMYQYSLDSFVKFLYKAVDRATPSSDIDERCGLLKECIRLTIFTWVVRGLFERHKLIFTALLTFRVLSRGQLQDEYKEDQFNFLLRGPTKQGVENPVSDWLPNPCWGAVQKLIELQGFETLSIDIEKNAPTRFKEWVNEPQPEQCKLPLEWKRLDTQPFQKLLVIRCLRPDRMTTSIADYIRHYLPNGANYMDTDAGMSFGSVLSSSFEDSTNTTPIFFILSAGADPVKEVEALGKPLGIKAPMNFHSVSMGQGQDIVAAAKLELGHKEGHWIMLENIHLMPKWTVELEKKLDDFATQGSHPNFRCFLSSDPVNYVPIGILERSVKLTNEPPQGLKANFRRALAFFPKDDFDDKDGKVKSILFGLCFFHSVMLERKKFGPKGWNMKYPFSIGDLRDSATVLQSYMESSTGSKVPWDDLSYIFGEIMYGGHIVDARDRLLCMSYLDFYMKDALLDETELFPYCEGKGVSYRSCAPTSYERYVDHIDSIPSETPLAFGLHPNAELGFRTQQCEDLLSTLLQLQPRDAGGGLR